MILDAMPRILVQSSRFDVIAWLHLQELLHINCSNVYMIEESHLQCNESWLKLSSARLLLCHTVLSTVMIRRCLPRLARPLASIAWFYTIVCANWWFLQIYAFQGSLNHCIQWCLPLFTLFDFDHRIPDTNAFYLRAITMQILHFVAFYFLQLSAVQRIYAMLSQSMRHFFILHDFQSVLHSVLRTSCSYVSSHFVA